MNLSVLTKKKTIKQMPLYILDSPLGKTVESLHLKNSVSH